MGQSKFTKWGAEDAATEANTTHRTSDGKDHSDVVANTAAAAANAAAIAEVWAVAQMFG